MGEVVHRTAGVEAVLGELPLCAAPPEGHSRSAYRRVEVYDRTGRPWPGTVTAWWTDPEGVELCRLRLSGAPTPRWTVFDSDRIVLLVQGGT
ncbi:hypothetical protein ACFVT5_09385 [Streptomyces sp. NPDC058001]|uniref:hypothetical protein n=1 Tax=Streptomyces sp. NPDC058001 TaxID=3346300 RepID=UPI0036E9DC83